MGGPEERAELELLGGDGVRVGELRFYDGLEIPNDFTDRSGRPVLHLSSTMLPAVIAMLEGPMPLYITLEDQEGQLRTSL